MSKIFVFWSKFPNCIHLKFLCSDKMYKISNKWNIEKGFVLASFFQLNSLKSCCWYRDNGNCVKSVGRNLLLNQQKCIENKGNQNVKNTFFELNTQAAFMWKLFAMAIRFQINQILKRFFVLAWFKDNMFLIVKKDFFLF